MRYESAQAFRAALDARIRNESDARKLEPGRLRRRVVFERIVARLVAADPDGWIVKGGVALEARFPHRARMTRDLDLAVMTGAVDQAAVVEEVAEALLHDPAGDLFEFEITGVSELAADLAGRPGWRLSIDARLGGSVFDSTRLEVVVREDEIVGVEQLELPNTLGFADIPPVTARFVDQRQHFAEKLHAFTRDYGDRDNSRVKDLPDMLLLIDNGLAPDAELAGVVEHVFAARGTHPVPDTLPDPAPAWVVQYPREVVHLDVSARTLAEAMSTLRTFWTQVREDAA